MGREGEERGGRGREGEEGMREGEEERGRGQVDTRK